MSKKKAAPPAAPRDPSQTEVTIGGRRYLLRGDDPKTLRELADEVDRTLEELSRGSRARDEFKLAVLTALNIASEHDERRKDWRESALRLRERVGVLAERVEDLRQRVAPSS